MNFIGHRYGCKMIVCLDISPSIYLIASKLKSVWWRRRPMTSFDIGWPLEDQDVCGNHRVLPTCFNMLMFISLAKTSMFASRNLVLLDMTLRMTTVKGVAKKMFFSGKMPYCSQIRWSKFGPISTENTRIIPRKIEGVTSTTTQKGDVSELSQSIVWYVGTEQVIRVGTGAAFCDRWNWRKCWPTLWQSRPRLI